MLNLKIGVVAAWPIVNYFCMSFTLLSAAEDQSRETDLHFRVYTPTKMTIKMMMVVMMTVMMMTMMTIMLGMIPDLYNCF